MRGFMNKDHNSLQEYKENPIWTEKDFEKAQAARSVLPKEFFEGMKWARKQARSKKSLKSD